MSVLLYLNTVQLSLKTNKILTMLGFVPQPNLQIKAFFNLAKVLSIVKPISENVVH